MYRLFVCVQYMQGANTTPLTVNYSKSMTGSPQSIAKILRFFCLSFKTKPRVNRLCEGYTGCGCASNTCKGQLQHHWLQIIQKVAQDHLNPLQRCFISSVHRLRWRQKFTTTWGNVQAVCVGPTQTRGYYNTIDSKLSQKYPRNSPIHSKDPSFPSFVG